MLLNPLCRRTMSSMSIMTFNVLAPCYFRHGGLIESSHHSSYIARTNAIINTIQAQQCDIICLQEYWFQYDYDVLFRKAFEPTHYFYKLKRPGKKQDGLAMFISKTKFDIHYMEPIIFNKIHNDRVAQLIHVVSMENQEYLSLQQRSFLVANCHITFPHSPLYKEVRLSQINSVLDAIYKYIQREHLQNIPVLICGDFNDYNDPVYEKILNYGFKSVFSQVHGREVFITHCNHNHREVPVDFIFTSKLPLITDQVNENTGSSEKRRYQETPLMHGQSRLYLEPKKCDLVPRRLPDKAGMKRPIFGQDWSQITIPSNDIEFSNEESYYEELLEYWRLISDHRPVVAKFDLQYEGENRDR